MTLSKTQRTFRFLTGLLSLFPVLIASLQAGGETASRIRQRNPGELCYPDGCQCLGLFLVCSTDCHNLLWLPILHSLRKCNSRLCDPFRFLVVPAYNGVHLRVMHNRSSADCPILLPLRCVSRNPLGQFVEPYYLCGVALDIIVCPYG